MILARLPWASIIYPVRLKTNKEMIHIIYKLKRGRSFLVIMILILMTAGCQKPINKLNLADKDGILQVDNGLVKARFTKTDGGVSQEYFATRNGEWILVAESFRPITPSTPQATQLFNTSLDPKNRFLVSESVSTVAVESQNDREIILRF